MNRKEFMKKTSGLCAGCGMLLALAPETHAEEQAASQLPKDPQTQFIQNWLADLLDTIDTELDEETKIKLMSGCGKGCFHRHRRMQNIAEQGKGDIDKLIAALNKGEKTWREGDLVHIQFGETLSKCYCAAATVRTPHPNDMHCYCTLANYRTVWETALGRPFKLDIVETLRRGGKTCHFIVHLT